MKDEYNVNKKIESRVIYFDNRWNRVECCSACYLEKTIDGDSFCGPLLEKFNCSIRDERVCTNDMDLKNLKYILLCPLPLLEYIS